MKRLIRHILSLLLVLVGILSAAQVIAASKQEIPASSRQQIARVLTRITAREVIYGWVRVERIQNTRKCLRIYTTIGLSYYPFREENVRAMYDSVRRCLPPTFARTPIEIYTDGQRIEELIPLGARSGKPDRRTIRFTQRCDRPLVECQTRSTHPTQGLAGRHIALWQSHGRYFDQRENQWRWQRTLQWQTCEDLFTQSFVIPFLVPMLEHAGAYVLLPRERDVQKNEWIIDNDPGIPHAGIYEETCGAEPWHDGGMGFAHKRYLYRADENPFTEGTTRCVRTVSGDAAESSATWRVSITETGDYGIYVSYQSSPESADDAMYTVHHAGGTSRYSVNQQMGGGTWIYLGSFRFRQGDEAVVSLSNRSSRSGRIVTADAVKIGGGFGNIARTVCDSLRCESLATYNEQPSGFPRSCEGARYWLQWAGFSPAVYSPKRQTDDYKDDYMCRALWVNALMGGSERLPDSVGLGIPIDMALGFHSDSGVRRGDETIGTLGIFCTKEHGGRFEGGASRYRSRDLTDLVVSQVVSDVRRTFEPRWTRRGLWNRSYYEARVPFVPTALLELMSHQNFADMQYGSDPRFRFLVSRAVYKGILKHLAAQYGQPYKVQPLPVQAFAVQLTERGVRLTWKPTVDSLEATAVPEGYVVYTRVGDGGFDKGIYTSDPYMELDLTPGELRSYRVTAVNAGGESFPSETLAAYRAPNEQGQLLVVNGFDRVSGPYVVDTDSIAGFRNDRDSGVPYLYDIAYAGPQQVFDRSRFRAADSCALGSCSDIFGSEIIGGNSFDYPYVHGESAAIAGWSFASVSVAALTEGMVTPDEYDAIDLILGKQRATTVGCGMRGVEFRTFPPALQEVLAKYVEQGGGLFVSGCYAVADLMLSNGATEQDRNFASDLLHCTSAGCRPSHEGRFTILPSAAGLKPCDGRFRTSISPDFYAIERTTVLSPADANAFVVMCYTDDRTPVGVAWCAPEGTARTIVLGFPFEAIDDTILRHQMMGQILRFLQPIKKDTNL